MVLAFRLVGEFGGAYAPAAVAVPLFWLGGRVVAALVVAAVAIHAALVASHVANQTLALTTTCAPATANSAYVVAGFAGGATASALAGLACTRVGWGGVVTVACAWLLLGWVTTAIRR